MKNTTTGDMSRKEALKSARDVLLGGVAYVIPQLLEILGATDFGGYSTIVSLVLAGLTPFINRYVNIWRVK